MNEINNALKSQNEELNNEKNNNSSQIKKLISLNEQHKNKILNLEKSLGDKEQEILNLDKNYQLIQNENKNILSQLNSLQQENIKLNNIIKTTEKEINNYKLINNQLIDDNTKKQDKIAELMENPQQESLIMTLDNLKQEIKEYKNKIKELTEKNKELQDSLKYKNTNNHIDMNNLNKKKFMEIEDGFIPNQSYKYNNNINYFSENRISNITEDKNLINYKERIKEYKEEINLLLIQINTLKEQIKEYKKMADKPIVQNFDEFVKLFNLAFIGYKPFRKDQNEAFELIKNKFIYNQAINLD